jgi:tetratricopeptide (TPR) repeat protein
MTLKALWVLNRASQDDFAIALEQLETATRLDPASPLPWNLISLIHYETALKGWASGDRGGVLQLMQEMLCAAQRAVEIDPSGWMGHSLASAGELWAGASYTRARFHADQALDLNPSAGLAHHFSGCVYGFGGDLDEAISVQSQTFRIDPDYLHSDVIEADLGLWRFLLGDSDAARMHLQRAVALNPRNARARQRLVALHGSLGDINGARDELARLEALAGPLTAEYLAASYPFQRPEHFARLAAGLKRAGVALD